MPTTVTASNGNVYHLLQLSTANSVKQFEESIGFSRLRNRLSDGFRSRRLLGSNTGNRGWRLSIPTLAHFDFPMPLVTGVHGGSVSREEYLWDLYCECEVTGQPFAIQSERNRQYYLCEFIDERLTYEGMKVKLYSTGVELEQTRLPGVTLFNPDVLSNVRGWFNELEHTSGSPGGWGDQAASPDDIVSTGDVLETGTTQNGHLIMRLNSAAGNGYLVQ